ncbi:MAG TPA: DedA family protein [Opitutaceae bacterium]
MHDLVQRLVDWYQLSLQSGGYAYIVFLMALESSVVPIPSEVIIPPAVILVMGHKAPMTIYGIVLAGALGSWIGATIMYWVSRIAGRPFVMAYGGYFFMPAEKIERAERWSDRFGSFGILISRVLPVIRHLIGIPAGVMRMNFLKYSGFTLIGSLFWCAVLAYISTVAGHDERLMHGEIREITIWLAGAGVVLAGVYYFLVHRIAGEKA